MAAAPFKVKAIFEYTSGHEDDLPFEIGQVITVTDVDDPDWYGGEYVDPSGEKREGIFPRNFVEKYEPVAPPRPTRTKKKEADPAPPAPAPTSPPAAPEPEPEPESDPEPEPVAEGTKPAYEELEEETPLASPPPVAEPRSPKAPAVPGPRPVEPIAPAAPVSEPPTTDAPVKASGPARGGPPPVTEKPASSSFKDRIAAFNKPAAPPIAPFKPGSLSSGSGSGFIKKPFVAPPPSRNAYVPPPREKPAPKVYRRDEDPEIKEKEAENTENAAKAGLVAGSSQEGEGDDQPKPMSLKERMALLQKQQTEAAQRHADAAAKKEKPKRPPPKKRTESQEPTERTSIENPEIPSLERENTDFLDEAQPAPPPRQPLPVRRKSKSAPEDGNEADMSGAGDTTEGPEELTERDESDGQSRPLSQAPVRKQSHAEAAEEKEGYEDEVEEAEDEEEEEEDPEVKRKEELRARMAKMSAGMGGMGGMGMMGMHNPFAAPLASAGPAKKKKPTPAARRSSEHGREEVPSSPRPAPPVPTAMALPGMGRESHKEEAEDAEDQDSPVGEDITPVATTSPRPAASEPLRSPMLPPPVPGGRPAPPPVPAESRPVPPPPPAAITSPSVGSESDDELSESQMQTLETPRAEAPSSGRAPPPPIPIASPTMVPTSPRSAGTRSSFGGDELSPTSPGNKRISRPPPIPGAAPPAPAQSRPPPPPPPGAAPERTSTSDERVAPMKPGRLDNGEEGEITDYDGDYDTDIASSVPHKDALKSHARDSSLDETASLRSPVSEAPPPSFPPPIPAAAPRAIPPPVPSQPPPPARPSADMPRAAPPPPPPTAPVQTESSAQGDDDEYDPYRYSGAHPSATTNVSYNIPAADHDVKSPEAAPSYQSPPPPANRSLPPAPPSQAAPSRAPPRQSMDAQRPVGGRRSMDVGRPSMSVESGFIANDVDLAQHTSWWLQPNGLPPVFQGRRDIFSESDESTTSAPGGRTVVTKDVYILYQDYSQTIITVRFDPQNPADTDLDQRHEPPPRSLRQDQLEQAYERFGLQISNAVTSKKDSVVGDGSPQALVYELLKPFKDVLLPVGTRAYGALVYANIANASTQMTDEIRPGDIISIRNAKFQGKHGPMHAKYSVEVGKPDHVAVVAEWDGTKKKVRAWEQGRENKKVKQESFKLDDLRSGEVKIWRVMPRSWVGWDSQN
ncbi:hypothetical protein E8E14_002917 [Neopestalotiopsis sp. 37M]|nr:hypothetical protein E8E14_002917 [Neopestalotiopsis sp. 37M]